MTKHQLYLLENATYFMWMQEKRWAQELLGELALTLEPDSRPWTPPMMRASTSKKRKKGRKK